RRLEHDYTVIKLLLAVMAVAAEPRPFADIRTLEIGASRQDHVGELRFAFEPDRLIGHEFQVRRLIHPYPAIGIVHRREDRGICTACAPAHARVLDTQSARTGARSIFRSRDSPRPCRRRWLPERKCAGCAGRWNSLSAAAACADRARRASRCFPGRPT